MLQLRAKIAQGQPDQALSEIESDSADGDKPELVAVKALAQFASGDTEGAEKVALDLVAKTEGDDNASVLVCCGIVLQGVGKSEEALTVLGRHQGSLEAYVFPLPHTLLSLRKEGDNRDRIADLYMCSVALIVQIHLQQNRSDLALKEVQAAKRWAQDSLLVNLAESWVGMRVVCVYLTLVSGYRVYHQLTIIQGGEQYQSAFYVYEELASTPSTTASLSIVGQAVAELHLGRLPEAEAALTAALEKYPNETELISNSVVLNALAGKPTADLEQYVSHSFSRLFFWLIPFFLDVCSKPSPRIAFYLISKRRASYLILLLLSTPHGYLRDKNQALYLFDKI